jgi:hypothetical protein
MKTVGKRVEISDIVDTTLKVSPLVVKLRASDVEVWRLRSFAIEVHWLGALAAGMHYEGGVSHPFGAVPIHVDDSLPVGVCELDFTDGSVKRLNVGRG